LGLLTHLGGFGKDATGLNRGTAEQRNSRTVEQ